VFSLASPDVDANPLYTVETWGSVDTKPSLHCENKGRVDANTLFTL